MRCWTWAQAPASAARELKRRFRRARGHRRGFRRAHARSGAATQPLLAADPLRQADARALPFEAASFDLVFSNLMLQWLLPPDAALAEMRRVLKPGGLLLAQQLRPETLQRTARCMGRQPTTVCM